MFAETLSQTVAWYALARTQASRADNIAGKRKKKGDSEKDY